MYRSRIGALDRSPRIRMRAQDIMWQALDHRAGFLLSQVDGRTTFDEIIEISGLSELDATRILARLVEHGVIG
jgi:CRP-like cAMP-binding protein